MTVTTDSSPRRYGIYSRTRGTGWALVVTTGDRAAAEQLMFALAAEAKHSADWCVRRIDHPPTEDGRLCGTA